MVPVTPEPTEIPVVKVLRVEDLLKFLQKCRPDAKVLAYELNSNAYVSQPGPLPNLHVNTVAEWKKAERRSLEGWFKGSVDAEEKVNKEMTELFRYASDDDVIIGF